MGSFFLAETANTFETGSRVCGWMRDSWIGNLLTQTFDEIIHSERARKIRSRFKDGDFSFCDATNCPYIANGQTDEILVEYDETALDAMPEELYLAQEGNCNYNCTCCTSYMHMKDCREHNYAKEYDLLDERLKPVLPYVRTIGANGRGELFCSPHILRLRNEWKPVAPHLCKVLLETNGALFNEKNWEKIKNLGAYNLHVAITIMSFEEDTYQYLSGTKEPISKLISSLRFVRSLREKGIINHFELATVLQEANFREMPEFTRRCIEEFGADKVRIRQIQPGGEFDEDMQWFMCVWNSCHPYYPLYKKVMQNDIFKHPKVLLWANDLDANLGMFPGSKRKADADFNAVEVKRLQREIDMLRNSRSWRITKPVRAVGHYVRKLFE